MLRKNNYVFPQPIIGVLFIIGDTELIYSDSATHMSYKRRPEVKSLHFSERIDHKISGKINPIVSPTPT
jgi:hypothetical protein